MSTQFTCFTLGGFDPYLSLACHSTGFHQRSWGAGDFKELRIGSGCFSYVRTTLLR